MEPNKCETAIRCLEVAVDPNTSDDEVVAAVNRFRQTAEGTPLADICAELAGARLSLADLAVVKDTLDRLNRENGELRRKLAIGEAAQGSTARHLDGAFRRIQELTEELAEARRQVDMAVQEFTNFRDAYARALDGANHDDHVLRSVLEAAQRATAEQPARPAAPFRALLAEARLGAIKAPPYFTGNGSGRLPTDDLNQPHPGTA